MISSKDLLGALTKSVNIKKLAPEDAASLWLHVISVCKPILPHIPELQEVEAWEFNVCIPQRLDIRGIGLFPETKCITIPCWFGTGDKCILLTSAGELFSVIKVPDPTIIPHQIRWKVSHENLDGLAELMKDENFIRHSLLYELDKHITAAMKKNQAHY